MIIVGNKDFKKIEKELNAMYQNRHPRLVELYGIAYKEVCFIRI